MTVEHWWYNADKGKPKYWQKNPVPLPLCPQQIAHRLTWDCTQMPQQETGN